MDLELTGVPGIIKKAREIETTPFARNMMGEIALYVMDRIKTRTLRGEDVNGYDFDPYSPGYKKWRQKSGYKTAPVDLTLTGHMLSAMTETHDANSAKIFFMDTKGSDGESAPDKAFWNQEDRNFFGINDEDIKGIMKIVTDYYEKVTGRRTLQ